MLSIFLIKADLPDYIEIISSLNLLALLGGLAIWLLDRKKEKDKIRYEEKKQIKRILFVLLEIRLHLVTHLKVEKISNNYATVLKEKISSMIEGTEEVPDSSISEFTKPIIEKIFGALKGDDKPLLKQFQYCIESLSEIDPILSYRLNGKQNIKAYLDTWEDSLKDYHYEYDENASEEDFTKFISIVKPHALEAIILDFDEMIKEIASLINKKTKKEAEAFLTTDNDEDMKKGMKSELDSLFDTLEEKFGDSKM